MRVRLMSSDDWISLEEAVPDTVSTVLVCRAHGNRAVSPARYSNGQFIVTELAMPIVFEEPTHWQFLPDAPSQ